MLKLESINTKTLRIILIAASVVFVAVCIAVVIAIKHKYESIAPKNIGFALTEIKSLCCIRTWKQVSFRGILK